MHIIVVDDENLILKGETAVIHRVLPDAEIASFRSAAPALQYAQAHRIDIAFLDISMKSCSGLELAEQLKVTNPKVNIIFCTGYTEYALEALRLHCSDYLLKPLSEEAVRDALSQLRHPLPAEKNRIRVQCFGNFEVFCDGIPVKFKYIKTKEMLACLIDRKGALISTNDIMTAMFGGEDKGSYIRNMKSDLVNTFQTLGVEDVLIQQKGQLGIHADKLDCDYYEYLNGGNSLFHGEYMSQYAFGEETRSGLAAHQER